MKQKKVLIVLGSPNSPSGVLSEISENRLNYCFQIFEKGNLVLCTGGWGNHFNTSKKSHASYAKKYLIEKGLLDVCFLDLALSSNTVEDAVKIKPIISKLDNISLTIITSDYHLDRVKIIFKEILKDYNNSFIGVENNLNEEEESKLVLHERKAIDAIIQNGLYY